MRTLLGFLLFAAAIVGWLFCSPDVDRQVAANTLLLGLAVNAIALPLGIFAAQICQTRGNLSRLMRAICLAMLFVPLFVHVSAWDSAFGKLGWLSNSDWFAGPIVSGPWTMAIWIHAVAAVPQVATIFWLGLRASGRIHEEQATLDATTATVFWQITLPRLMPVLILCMVWIFITCAREIAVTDIYRIGTLAEQIYLGYSLGETDSVAAPLTIVLMILISAGVVFATTKSFVGHLVPSSDILKPNKDNFPRASGLQKIGGSLLLLVIVVVPTLNLVTRASRFVAIVDSVPTANYSLTNFWSVIVKVPGTFSTELSWSLLIAGASSILIMGISIGLIWKAFDSKFWQFLLLSSVAICCGLPGPLVGSGILWLRTFFDATFTDWLFDRTIFAPVLANIIFCWPVSCVFVWFILKNTAVDALEYARLEGASSFSRLFGLAVSGNAWALCGGLLIVFAICFGELSASQLAVPPGIDTVPRRMLGMLHSGVNDQTAGLTIVSVCCIIAVIGLGYCFVYANLCFNRRSADQ